MRPELEDQGVVIFDHAGTVRFVDAHTLEADNGLRLQADKVILCGGGTNRLLPLPGADLLGSHHDAWSLRSVPESLLVVGAGATGAQVASVFNELGSRVLLYEAAPRILMTEDEDVSRVMAESFRAAGIEVRESFGRILEFQRSDAGVRMIFAGEAGTESVQASVAVGAIGWQADTVGLNLPAAGVETTPRGYIAVDSHLRTNVSHIYAAGDITGRLMLVPQAVQDGFQAASNAVQDARLTSLRRSARSAVSPTPSTPKPDSANRRPAKITTSWSPPHPSPSLPDRSSTDEPLDSANSSSTAPIITSSAATSSVNARSSWPKWRPSPSRPA